MTERTVTYPADALQRVADRLCDLDWNLPPDEAREIAFEIVTDVTMAVDKLRASEGAYENQAYMPEAKINPRAE